MATGPATQPRARASRWKRVGFWSVRISVSLALPLLVGEGILRMVYREEEARVDYWGAGAFIADENLGYRHTPGFQGFAVRRGEFCSEIAINEQGLRQSSFESQLSQPHHLLLLGASYALGLGVEEEANFASLIQPELNAAGVGVINASQSGYCVEQAQQFGLEWAARVEPRTILLTMVPTHDAMIGYRKRYLDHDVVHGCRLPKRRALAVPAVDYLRTHSFLWAYVETAFKRVMTSGEAAKFGAEARADPEPIVRATLDSMEVLRRYCAERSIAFGVVVVTAEKVPSDLDQSYLEALSAEGIPVLHCGAPEFTTEDYFARDAHWNANGHRKAAAQVLEFLHSLD